MSDVEPRLIWTLRDNVSAGAAKLKGELEFHGVKQPIEVPVQVTFGGDGGALVTAQVPVSLEAHRLERPSLLLLKADDQLLMDVELKLVNAAK